MATIHEWQNTAGDFASDDFIGVDGATLGSRKMSKDTLLALTSQESVESIASEFSSANSYAVGDLVTYQGKLYKCTTAHSGNWNSSNFTATTVDAEMSRKANLLGTTSTDTDMDSTHALTLVNNDGTQTKLPANLVAKANDVAALGAKTDNISASIAPEFDPTRTIDNPYKASEDVMYNGTLYRFKVDHYGDWSSSDVFAIAVSVIAKTEVSNLFISDDYKKRLSENGDLTPVNFLNPEDPDVVDGWFLPSKTDGWTKVGNDGDELFGGDFGQSGFIPVIPGEIIYPYSATGTGLNNMLFFDENKNYVSRLYAPDPTGTTIPSGVYFIRVPFNQYQYRNGNAINSVLRVPVSPFVYYPYVKSAKEEYYTRESDLCGLLGGGDNLFNPNAPDVETGGFRMGSDNSWTSNSNFNESGYIPVIPGKTLHYYLERTGVDPQTFNNIQYCFYDKDKTFVSGGSFGNTSKKYISVSPSSNIRYIRVPVSNANLNKLCIGYHAFTKYIPYGQRNVVLLSDVKKELGQSDDPISQKAVTDAINGIDPSGAGLQWAGKKWYAYGTSITDTTPTGKYFGYLEEMSGMIGTDKGIGGGGIGNLGAYSQGQVFNAICNITDGKLEADLITLETGANDTGASVPLGTIYDTTQDTLAGCLNLCIRYLQANTDAQIAIMPSVATTTEPNEANQYYEWQLMIEQICTINRVYFIKPACNLGYGKLSSSKGSLYVADNIHQTNLGGYILAEAMWKQIKEIPLFRTALPT